MAEISGETAGIISASVAGIVAVGGGIKWLFTTRDVRQRMIDESVKRHTAGLEAKVGMLERRVTILMTGYPIMLGELARHDPDSPALQQAQAILEAAFEVPGDQPAEMTAALNKLT